LTSGGLAKKVAKAGTALFTTARTTSFPNPLLVWGIAFIYAVVLGLTLQKLILPLMPSLHAEHGLLQQDAIHYHTVAVQLADRIRTIGWSEWKLFPGSGGTGNVGLLAALYALLGPNPAWFIPFAAAAHATGATVIYLLGPLLWPGRVGRLGGLVAATLFVVFPSALLAYGQNYKDAFSIAGTLIIVYVWLGTLASPDVSARWWRLLAAMVIGIALVWCVRPYLLLVLTGGLALTLVIVAALAIIRHRFIGEWRAMVFGVACVVLISAAAIWLPKGKNLEDFNAEMTNAEVTNAEMTNATSKDWQWKSSEWVPMPIDKTLERISILRVGFAAHGDLVGAGSQIDADYLPDSVLSAIVYVPRAAMVGLFAPFPSTWTEKMNLIRIVGAMETMLWYVLVPGVILALVLRPSPAMFIGMIVCGIMITFYSYVQPNVGTLYRVRAGPFFFFILCGAIGWARVVLKLLSVARRRGLNDSPPGARAHEVLGVPTISDISAYGIAVVLLTAVGYFGFFVRDLLLVRIYGMGGQLDGFFSASMMPMFLVTVLVLPLADAMMAPFIKAGNGRVTGDVVKLVRSLISFACMVVIAAAVGLMLVADWVVPLFVPGGTLEQLNNTVAMLRWFSLVLALSAWTVVGNGVLNAVHRPLAAATAQLCVPVVAIAFIMVFTETMGLRSAILGMVVGTLANAVVVAYSTRRAGVKLIPVYPGRWFDMPLLYRNYALLALAALLVGLTIPINYAFAAGLEPGAVTAWALGGKLVQLLTGLAAVAAAAVLTPHFGRLMALGRSSQLVSDVYFILIIGTWVSIFGALVIFAFSEPIVVAIFQSDEVSELQARHLAAILRLGSLQMPFIVAITLIIKFAAVSRLSLRAVVAVGLGLAVNVMLNILLVPYYGVYGIAIATVVASAISATYLIIVMRKHCGLDWAQVALLKGSWLIMLGLSVGLYYRSSAAAIGAVVVMLILLPAQWRSWQQVGVSA
jgi:peptidoglycan biosynthesis protein MviN/MurJ (putative lipid II flippase)